MGSHKLLVLAGLLAACAPKRDPGPVLAAEAEGPVSVLARKVDGPVTWVQLAVRAGSAHDPVGKEGLAWVTGELLRQGGTAELPSEEVEELLYGLGTDIEVVVDRELVTFRTKALNADLAEVGELLADMLNAPALDEEVFGRLKGQAADELRHGFVSNDEALGLSVFDTWIFEGHPYGHPVEGRVGSLEDLTLQDVRDFLDVRYVKPALHLGVAGPAVTDAGGIDASGPGGAALVALHEALGERPSTLYQDVTPRAVPPVEGRELLVVEKSTDATGVHMGHPTELHRAHEDWPAMLLAMTAFGEHRQSHGRLYRNLRGDRGLNYGDYAYLEIYRQAGWSPPQQWGTGRLQNPFYIWLRPVTADNGPFATKAALALLEDFVENGLGEEEFTRIQAYLQGRVALWAPGPERRLGWALEAAAMGWPDPMDSLPEAIATLDRETVNAAIQRHLRPQDLKIVVVTADGAGFVEAVEGEAPTPIVYDAEPPAEDSAQAQQDAVWADYGVGLEGSSVISSEGIYQ